MSIFDFLAPPEPPKAAYPIELERDILKETILRGSGFENGKKRIYNFFKSESDRHKRVEFLKHEYGVGGWSADFGIVDHGANGLLFKFDEDFALENNISIRQYPWEFVSMRIDELIKSGEYTPEVCKFSEHTCNKEELWRVAIEIGVSCPKSCCRVCDIRDCGARCNGAPIKPHALHAPIIFHEGDIIYQVLRAEIIPYRVAAHTWEYDAKDGVGRGYQLDTLDEHPSHNTVWNHSTNFFKTLEEANKKAELMREIIGDDLLPKEQMNIVEVKAYTYIYSDFYKDGTDRQVINFYAVLDNGLIYVHSGSKYEHCYKDIKQGVKEYEEDKEKLLEYNKDITELSDYIPTLQNMYKTNHDTWDWAEARYDRGLA